MDSERHLGSIDLKIILSKTELSKYAQMETEYQKGQILDGPRQIQKNKKDEMVKYCSKCLTMENLMQVRSLQSELDLKFHQARRNCHQCQFKVIFASRGPDFVVIWSILDVTDFTQTFQTFDLSQVIEDCVNFDCENFYKLYYYSMHQKSFFFRKFANSRRHYKRKMIE